MSLNDRKPIRPVSRKRALHESLAGDRWDETMFGPDYSGTSRFDAVLAADRASRDSVYNRVHPDDEPRDWHEPGRLFIPDAIETTAREAE